MYIYIYIYIPRKVQATGHESLRGMQAERGKSASMQALNNKTKMQSMLSVQCAVHAEHANYAKHAKRTK